MFEFLIGAVVGGGLLLGLWVALKGGTRTPPAGSVLLVTSSRGTEVVRAGRFVWPLFERAELVDVSTSSLSVARTGGAAPPGRDGVRIEFEADLRIGVGPEDAAVRAAADAVGASRVGDPEARRALFEPKLLEAVGHQIANRTLDELLADPTAVVDGVRAAMGEGGAGFRIEGVSLRRLEPAPIEAHDPDRLPDAKGVQVLTQRAADAQRAAAEVAAAAARAAAEQQLEADVKIAELERDRALAEAQQQMEIAKIRAEAALAEAEAEIAVQRAQAERDAAGAPPGPTDPDPEAGT